MLSDMTLHEEDAAFGVESTRQQELRQPQGGIAELALSEGQGQGVEIDNAEDRVGAILHVHPVADRSEVVAQVQVTAGLDAGEHAGHGRSG